MNISTSHEAGSFRDRESRVLYANGEIFRGLSEKALSDWQALNKTSFFAKHHSQGTIVRTDEITDSEFSDLFADTPWKGALKHERIPFVSYPYEWCFSMLKDAALLQLELLLAALEENMILKDSSSFNIQWRGCQPVFIDIPSFEELKKGEPWLAYRQFCQLFLYPLFLEAYKGVSPQALLRGDIDGITPADCWNLLSLSDLLRPGIFKHVYLQQKFEAGYAQTSRDVKSEIKQVGFHVELIKANVTSIQKLIRKLDISRGKTVWSDYADNNNYAQEEAQEKREFVERVVAHRKRGLVWDLGCNTGTFSQIAAENADYVIAMDFDRGAIEQLYAKLSQKREEKILPLAMNVANPSPAQGWRGRERKTLADRGKPDMIMALALIHHVVLSANVPLEEFIEWLAEQTDELVIEFVTKDDQMVKTLLRNKEDIYDDYELSHFEHCLERHFEVTSRHALQSNTRILYHCMS